MGAFWIVCAVSWMMSNRKVKGTVTCIVYKVRPTQVSDPAANLTSRDGMDGQA